MTILESQREVLPSNVKPLHYTVNLTPDLEKFTFYGSVAVKLQINEATSKIVCNANELEIQSAKITFTKLKTEQSEDAVSIVLNKEHEQAIIEFKAPLEPGSIAHLSLNFTGILNDRLAGFYRSAYTDQQGVKKYMAVTQFEATDARRCFPCWDEPALKSTFDIILCVPTDRTALSNMNVIEEKIIEVNGKKLNQVKFATTPIMSTYLVAFVVGELEYIETTAKPTAPASAKPITVRVYTLKGQSSQGQFALDVAARTLEFFSKYFDVPYPLPKSDLVAIPDFGAGAMENWGLVTYRTVYVLWDEKSSSAKSKQNVAYVVGHELAHQWFGNLVTMEWWEHLWLNEGFATFVGWLATDNLFPEWNVWTQFVTDDFTRGLSLDALRSSHPIEVTVKSPHEINQIFDAISYSKGASVIRMLNSFLTTETFMNGIRSYLKKHAYGNATTGDLWKALSESSGKDVAALMKPWTRDVGYPLISVVEEKIDADKNELHLKIHQTRYLSSGDLTMEEDKNAPLWWVPLGVITHANPNKPMDYILTEKETNIAIPYDAKNTDAFYKLNWSSTGFFRVRYSLETLKKMGAIVQKGNTLNTNDRIALVADAFALAQSGQGSTVGALELLHYFENESNFNVLEEIASKISNLLSVWYQESESVVKGLRALIRKIFSSKVKELSWEYPPNEDHLTGMKRTLVIGMAAKGGDEEVIEEAKRRFKLFVDGNEQSLHPNIRGTVYSIVLKNSKDSTQALKDFESVLNIFKTAPTVDQKLAALGALGNTSDVTIIHRLLDTMILDGELIRSQDIIYPLGSLARSNPHLVITRPLLWTWCQKNWKILYERYHSSLSLLGRCLQTCVEDSIGLEFAHEVENWANGKNLSESDVNQRKHELKGVKRQLDQSLEKLRLNTKWLERERVNVESWIKSSHL